MSYRNSNYSNNSRVNTNSTTNKEGRKMFKITAQQGTEVVKLFASINSLEGEAKEFAIFKLGRVLPGLRINPKHTEYSLKTFNLKAIVKATFTPGKPKVDVCELLIEEGLDALMEAAENCGMEVEDGRSYNMDGMGDVLTPGVYDWFGRYQIVAIAPLDLRSQMALSARRVVVQYNDGKRDQVAYWNILAGEKNPANMYPFRIIGYTDETAESLGKLADGEWRKPVAKQPKASQPKNDKLAALMAMLQDNPELMEQVSGLLEPELEEQAEEEPVEEEAPAIKEATIGQKFADFLKTL